MKSRKIALMILAVMTTSLFLLTPVKASTFPSLPPTEVTISLEQGPTKWPGILTLSNVPIATPEYDVADGEYTAWCAQFNNFIAYAPYSYSAVLISSLDLAPDPWNMINYLLNNQVLNNLQTQFAIWLLLGTDAAAIEARYGAGAIDEGWAMYNDAITNGGNFVPGPGQIMAVYCDVEGTVQDLMIELEIPEDENGDYEGLTPGFWKTHPELWMGYSTDATFYDVFGVYITINTGGKSSGIYNPTLLEAIGAKGGVNEEKGVYDALARHAVAALLNAAHPDVNYPLTEQEIIDAVYDAIINGGAESLKNTLDMYNNAGGGIDAHGNPI